MSTTLLLSHTEPVGRDVEQHRVELHRLEQHLVAEGFELVSAGDPPPDLVLAGDPRELDRWRGEAPVIVLGREHEDPVDCVRAFRRGCDDYVALPLHYEELVERIRAVLRRAQPYGRRILHVGPLVVDTETRTVTVRGRPVTLAQREFDLVRRLAIEPHRVVTRAELLREVWEYESYVRTRTLDSHACKVRRKFRELDPDTLYLENVWGVGYRLLGDLPEPSKEVSNTAVRSTAQMPNR